MCFYSIFCFSSESWVVLKDPSCDTDYCNHFMTGLSIHALSHRLVSVRSSECWFIEVRSYWLTSLASCRCRRTLPLFNGVQRWPLVRDDGVDAETEALIGVCMCWLLCLVKIYACQAFRGDVGEPPMATVAILVVHLSCESNSVQTFECI